MDALAEDSLTAYLMGFNIHGVFYLINIWNYRLGKLFPIDKIRVLGENPDNLVTPFKPYRKFVSELKK